MPLARGEVRADTVKKSRDHHEAKYRSGWPYMPGSRSVDELSTATAGNGRARRGERAVRPGLVNNLAGALSEIPGVRAVVADGAEPVTLRLNGSA